MGDYQAKQSKHRYGCHCRFKSLPSLLIRVSTVLVIFLLWYSEEAILTNGDFPHKCKFLIQKDNFSVFRAFHRFAVS